MSGGHCASESADLIFTIRMVAGERAVAAFYATYGGQSVYVPRNPEAHHAVVRVVGAQAASALAPKFGGASYKIALGPSGHQFKRQHEIAELCLKGKGTSDIVREMRCSARWVSKVRSDLRRVGLLPPYQVRPNV